MDSNTSGHGVAAEVPTDLRRWNWGAFLLNWIWGLGNNTYIALLMFVPVVNFVMPFVLGAKGSAWAWRNKHWESVEQFKHVQRLWTIWGVIAWIAMIALSTGIWFSVVAMFKQSEPYQMAIARLQANAEATRALGTPITTGAPHGQYLDIGTVRKGAPAIFGRGSERKGNRLSARHERTRSVETQPHRAGA